MKILDVWSLSILMVDKMSKEDKPVFVMAINTLSREGKGTNENT